EDGSIEPLWEGVDVMVSAEGKHVLYWKSDAPGIYRRSLDGDLARNPEELLVADFWPIGQLGGFAPVAGGVYYVSADAHGKPGPFRYFDYRSRKSVEIAPAAPAISPGFSVSPDHRSLLYAAREGVGGDIWSLALR